MKACMITCFIVFTMSITALCYPAGENITDGARIEALTNSLVGLWRFEEGSGTVSRDYSGQSPALILHGAQWGKGKYGSGLRLNGAEKQYALTRFDHSVIKPGKEIVSFTIAAWILPENVPGSQFILGREGSHAGLFLFRSASNAAFRMYAVKALAAAPELVFTVAPSFSDMSAWQHIAGVYDDRKISLYVNGALVKSAALTGGIRNYSDDFFIGGCGAEFFTGIIDEVYVYARALNASEIQMIMKQEGDLVDRPQSAKGTKSAPAALEREKAASARTIVAKNQFAYIKRTPALNGARQFFSPGEAVVNVPDRASNADSWVLLSYAGTEISRGSVDKANALALGTLSEGFYRLQYKAADNVLGYSGIFVREEPRVPASNISLDVGMSRFWGHEVAGLAADIARRTGVGAARGRWAWSQSEDTYGKREFTLLNELFEIFENKQMPLNIYTTDSPGFANNSGKASLMLPSKLRYLYEHYRWAAANWPHAIRMFECWNEPDMGYGTGAHAASMTKVMALALRSVRPDILVVTPSPATSSLENYFAEMLANDLYPYVSAYAFHHHTPLKKRGAKESGAGVTAEDVATTEPSTEPAELDRGHSLRVEEDSLDYMYRRYASHAKHSGGLPAVNTEGAIKVDDRKGWKAECEQAEGLLAYLATSLHLGISEHQYFNIMLEPGAGADSRETAINHFLTEFMDQSPRAGLFALAVAASFLGNAVPRGRFSVSGTPSARVLVFQSGSAKHAGSAVVVFWDLYHGGAALPYKKAIVFDHMGGAVTTPDASVITWPPKYALVPVAEAKASPLRNEAVFPLRKAADRQMPSVVLDISLPDTAFTTRPVSGIKVNDREMTLPLSVYNFSDAEKRIALSGKADDISISIDNPDIRLGAQQDTNIVLRIRAEDTFFTKAHAFSPSRQMITAVSGGETSVLAFNVFADTAHLPVANIVPIEGIADAGRWYQQSHEKGDRGTAKCTAVKNGMQFDFEFSKRGAPGFVIPYIRCKLAGMSAPMPDTIDALRVTFVLNRGSALFQITLIGEDGTVWYARPGKLNRSGDTLTTSIPTSYFGGARPLVPSEVKEMHLCLIEVPHELAFSISDVAWVTLK
ncbi:MAG: LamG domain-containing protein [Spirochaetota bacterium]